MFSKISGTFILAASLFASSSGTPLLNATNLDGRAAACQPAAESCATTACCAGLFCSLTAPHTCSNCIPSAEFCIGVPCCSGLFCGLETGTCGPCTPTGRASCFNFPCCSGLCGTDGFCH
ncbi:hypothetical protein FB451DRAFT_1208081 [Mycena latifolia]|nr:hypothetical protein FB451DRAFT_1208081 [Mycena latifolia]